MNEHENCHVEPVERPLDMSALKASQAAIFGVSGMGCPRCVMRVHNGLLLADGVLYADVNLQDGVAAVAYDPARVTIEGLVNVVAHAGNDGRHHYQAYLMQTLPAQEAFIFPAED